MPQTLEETNTRLAALPVEIATARGNVETTQAARQAAHESYADALGVLQRLKEEKRVLRRHKEKLTGLPA